MGNVMMSWISNFAMNHQQMIEGIIIGAIISNPGTCAVLLFNLLIKIPGIGLWISKNPEKAKGWADQFDKAIDAQIDKYSEKTTQP